MDDVAQGGAGEPQAAPATPPATNSEQYEPETRDHVAETAPEATPEAQPDVIYVDEEGNQIPKPPDRKSVV